MKTSSAVYATADTLAGLVGAQPPETSKRHRDQKKKKPSRDKDIKTSRSLQRY
jgi:hypothetical protein